MFVITPKRVKQVKSKVVIYARFSSHSQTEQSIEGQLRECYEFAKRNDYVVVDEYIDRAISGMTDNRPAFLQMIEDSKKKEFEYVLVYQLDRFARSRYDSANLQAQLKEIDKQIESLITAIMNGLNSKSIELKIKQLENEKSILTEKMVLSESHQTKPIKPEDIKHFI